MECRVDWDWIGRLDRVSILEPVSFDEISVEQSTLDLLEKHWRLDSSVVDWRSQHYNCNRTNLLVHRPRWTSTLFYIWRRNSSLDRVMFDRRNERRMTFRFDETNIERKERFSQAWRFLSDRSCLARLLFLFRASSTENTVRMHWSFIYSIVRTSFIRKNESTIEVELPDRRNIERELVFSRRSMFVRSCLEWAFVRCSPSIRRIEGILFCVS